MGVEIDEPRADEVAGDVEGLFRHCGRDLRLDRGDQRIADADIAPRAQVLARVEHVAAADDEIVRIARAERRGRGERAPAGAERERRRARIAQELPSRQVAHVVLP